MEDGELALGHFAAAVVFLVAGAGVLTWRAPALAAGAFSDPGLVAGAHLLTLGWISTSVMGVLHRLLAVVLEAPVRRHGLARATFVLWTGGVAAFAFGVAAGRPVVLLAGTGALGAAALSFAANATDTLRRSARRGLTWWCVVGAVVSLAGAWLLGGLLAVNLVEGLLDGSRFTVLAVHLHVAGGGWVLLTMIAMAERLLPASLLSRRTGDLPARAAAALVGAGTAALLLSGHLLPVGVLDLALGSQAAGAAVFLLQVGRHFRGRRRQLGPGTRLVAASAVSLGAAVAVGVGALLASSTDGRLLTVYGVLLVPGGLGLFVAGHACRTVPLLTRPRPSEPGPARRDPPPASSLPDPRAADVAGALLSGGVVLLALGVATAEPGLCRIGALGFGSGAVIHALQMLRVARRRPDP